MAEEFRCKEGCNKCCPTSDKKILAEVSLGDISRAYDLEKYESQKSLLEYFNENYELHLDAFFNPKGKNGIQSHVYDVKIRPMLKIPCTFLHDAKCRLHATDAKPLVCQTQPELRILYNLNLEQKVFECIEPEKDYSFTKQRKLEIDSMYSIYMDERLKTENYFYEMTREFPDFFNYLIPGLSVSLNKFCKEEKIIDKAEKMIEGIGLILKNQPSFLFRFFS